jgi:hypothetical protein
MQASFSIEPTEQNIPTMPTLLAEEKTSRFSLSPTAVAFIADHTTTATDVSAIDECPICFETYSKNKPCVQIKGLGSCAHRFCRSCVSVLVSRKSNADIKCAICRTVWVAGARTSREGTSNIPNQSGPSQPQRQELPAATQPLVSGQPVIVDLSNETESYDTQVQNFHQAARAIEDVRARARNTQLSRSERRQEMREETARRRAAERQGRLRSKAIASILGASIPTSGNRAGSPRAPPTWAEQQATATMPFNLPMPATSADLRLDFGSPRINPAASSSIFLPASEPATRPRIAVASKASGISNDDQRNQALTEREIALDGRDSVLIQRTTELNSRATALNTRDTELNDRENRLNELLTSVLQREKDVAAREELTNAKARVLQKHRDEMENLIKKQEDEMDTLQ